MLAMIIRFAIINPSKRNNELEIEMLKAKWENLIKKETGADVKVNLVGEDKIQVLVKGDKAFDVFNLFFGKNVEILDDGFLVAL